jgi:anaerobic magnesium-protoporphyrin IX monomethyl ester cyclase
MPSGTRSEALDSEVLPKLKASGVNAIICAPESGSVETLKAIKKKINPQRMLKSMRQAVKAGITVRANIIFGFPHQAWPEVFATFRFLFGMIVRGAHDVLIFPFVPYPGSELFNDLLKSGKLTRESESYSSFFSGNIYNNIPGVISWSNHLSARTLKLLSIGGMAIFYGLQFLLRLWRDFMVLHKLVRGTPATAFERMPATLLRRKFLGKRFCREPKTLRRQRGITAQVALRGRAG